MVINVLFGSSLPEIYIYIYIYRQRFCFLSWLYTWLQNKNYQIWGLPPRFYAAIQMVAPIPIVLRVTPKDGSFKAKTFTRFKDASKFTGLSISGLREAYHKKRTKMTRSDGFEFELQWLQDISTDLPTRKSGCCKWELPNGEVCGIPLVLRIRLIPSK